MIEGDLDNSICISEVLEFMDWLNEQSWCKVNYGEKEGLWISMYNDQGMTSSEVLEHWRNDY